MRTPFRLSTAILLLFAPGWAVGEPAIEVIQAESQPWYEAEDRAVARELASPRNSRAREMSIAEIRVPAGVAVRPHRHDWEETYLVRAGNGVMMLEDAERAVDAGDSIVIRRNEWHAIRNTSEESDLELIVVCTPAWRADGLVFER